MRRNSTRHLAILLLTLSYLFTGTATAEIYKWIDADGNVHFGDKPKDPELANQAEPVELNPSYQPPERTAQEQQAFEDEQRAKRQEARIRQRAQEEDRVEAQAKSREEKATLCAAYQEDITRLSTMEIVNGRRQITYLEEDGKSVSAERQREIVAELRADSTAAGCK